MADPIQVSAAELFNGCSNTRASKLKDGSGYVVRASIPTRTGRAPLWMIYGKSLGAVRRILCETHDILGSRRVLFIEDYVQDTNLIHDVALLGSNGAITCNSWTQKSWGRKAHIGYICGDGYRLDDEAEDVLLGVAACLLGPVDAVTAKICDEAKKAFGRC